MSEVALEEKLYNSPEDFTDEEAVALSGLLGIHPDLKKEDIKELTVERKSQSIIVSAKSTDIRYLQVVIYPAKRYISNEYFVGEESKHGLAELWVKSQVHFASLFPFTKFEGSAHRDDHDKNVNWKGYYIWPRYGYIMDDNTHNFFLKRIRREGRIEGNILELISNTDGYNYWKQHGYTWDMLFDLEEDSISRKILTAFIPYTKN